jgi:hypothetical protein
MKSLRLVCKPSPRRKLPSPSHNHYIPIARVLFR